MKILITGGAGFIGSNFIRYYLKAHPGDSIINLDKLTYAGNLTNLREVEKNSRYEFVRGDINDPEIVTEVMAKADAVINFAAETHVDRSIKDSAAFIQTNYCGLFTLISAARNAGVQRFLHISTDEVYGSIEKGSFSEESRLAPRNPYSAAKAAADLLAGSFWTTYRFPVLIARSSNNFGPNQFPEKVIPLFMTNLIEGKKVPLYAKGENVRDWTFVEDNCRGVDLVFQKGEPGEIYNISSGNEMTNLELADKILACFGKGRENIQYVADRPGHDLRYSLNTDKARRLGFSPVYSFDQALELTARWYRDNPEWWQTLKQDEFTRKL